MGLGLKQLWSATDFSRDEVTAYANDFILPDTRRGLILLASLLLLLQCGTWILQLRAGQGDAYFYTFCLLSLLSVHVLFSAHMISETRVLHALAMTYLVICGTAIALIAHRMGTFNIGLMGSAVLLIVAIPLVPWGLKQAVLMSLMIYGLFTLSVFSVGNRFDADTIFTLQFLFIASSIIVWALVARNVRVRKDEIENRFDLERTRHQHEMLALTDPLTGAWNRRFLEQNFQSLVDDARSRGYALQFALFDVDRFKQINDGHGHHNGDLVLKRLVELLGLHLPDGSCTVRFGGDEFAVLYGGRNFRESVAECLGHIASDSELLEATRGAPVTISVGYAQSSADESVDIDDLYRRADGLLYATKISRCENEDEALSTALRHRMTMESS